MILEKRLPLSYLLGAIKWDLVLIFIFSTIIHIVSVHVIRFSLPINIGAFMGTAISLVLSFKISQSYDRWWEARKIWGAIVNDSRSLIIQLLQFTGSAGQTRDFYSRFAYRQIAWCYVLGQALRKQDTTAYLQQFLSQEEFNRLKNRPHKPMALLNLHAQDIRSLQEEGQLNAYQQIQLDDTLVRLCASMGKAERIKNTVFPKTYRKTLHYFIYIFLVMLSFAMTEYLIYIEVPVLLLISIPFFLLEKIAYHMQDPFENRPTDTSVTAIARTIETNIKQLLEEEELPEPMAPERFYIM